MMILKCASSGISNLSFLLIGSSCSECIFFNLIFFSYNIFFCDVVRCTLTSLYVLPKNALYVAIVLISDLSLISLFNEESFLLLLQLIDLLDLL
jgi:hypothetical protein